MRSSSSNYNSSSSSFKALPLCQCADRNKPRWSLICAWNRKRSEKTRGSVHFIEYTLLHTSIYTYEYIHIVAYILTYKACACVLHSAPETTTNPHIHRAVQPSQQHRKSQQPVGVYRQATIADSQQKLHWYLYLLKKQQPASLLASKRQH